MFKLPNFPSPSASEDELADFAEVLAWRNGIASSTSISRYLSVIADNIDFEGDIYQGCEDQEDKDMEYLESVCHLLEDRRRTCGNAYPFELIHSGSTLRLIDEDNNLNRILYLYLLVATRLNMKKDNSIGGIDGALLMEEICSISVGEYLGSKRARTIVFGTASSGSFKERVNRLIRDMEEPCSFQNVDGENAIVRARDDGVDIVGWIPFNDRRSSKLSMFVQVKTGTSWRDRLYECQPEAFMTKWMTKGFVVNPVRAFCVAEALSENSNWNGISCDVGVFFDRCRIVSCFNPDSFSRTDDLEYWVRGAKDKVSGMLSS